MGKYSCDKCGKDFTLFALKTGKVEFIELTNKLKKVQIT